MSRSTANWLLYTPLVIIYVLFVRTEFAAGSELLDELMDALGLFVALIGVVIRIFARDWKASRVSAGLVTTGPYAVVRNPMYIGSFLIGLGFCVLIGNIPFLMLYTVSYALTHRAVVRHEERALAKHWPEEYTAYAASVPAWTPSLIALIREHRNDRTRLSCWRQATARELNPLCGAFIGAFALEAREDYIVEGWKVAQAEVTLFIALAVLVLAARMICSTKRVRKYLTSG